MSLLDALSKQNIINEDDVASIEAEAKASGESVEQVLIKRGVAARDILAAKGDFSGVPTADLSKQPIPFDVLRLVPEESVRYYQFVPLAVTDGVLHVGIVDPNNIEARDALQFIAAKLDMPFKLFVISEDDFARALDSYKSLSGEVSKALSELETEIASVESEGPQEERAEGEGGTDAKPAQGEEKITEDAPVTKIVATILKHAIEGGASDIHVEPTDLNVRVRYRVDGILQTSIVLPKKVHLAVVARIKILSNMKLDEKRKPQDNRFLANIAGKRVDFRVSTFPTYFGEKVVMRLLDPSRSSFSLDAMGFSPRNLELVRKAIDHPYGIVLISGPTGSGKSTTLYAMLQELNRDEKNVLSLEDPVEYQIEGVNQSQVRPEIGYTFATGLRTTLRQDPDIIMVGEIRDKETAQLAVQAALTGHLVLSTIHTNNSLGVIPRLVDMGVDPYLIAPTLILAMAQRLVRTFCPGAEKPVPVNAELHKLLERQFADLPEEFRKDIVIPDTVYDAQPTADCPKGVRGRTAVFEVLQVDPAVEQAILESPTEQTLMKLARKQGMITMKEDALLKAFRKEIPFTEVSTIGSLEETGYE